MNKPPVIAIVGPTASGKTALAIDAALALNGEVVSADSRQVYRGLDIGSAKVTPAEMQGIPHHLIDVVDPCDIYTGADYLRDGNNALANITKRDKLPIVTGGTYFYIALLSGQMTPAPAAPNHELRTELESLTNEQLVKKLKTLDPAVAVGDRIANRRRLIRAIEIITALGHLPKPTTAVSPYTWHYFGIEVPLDTLTERIRARISSRIDQGLFEEIIRLHDEGVTYERLESFGLEYTYGSHYIKGTLTKDAFIETLTLKTRQFAKRQYTWLKRDKNIIWLNFPVDSTGAIELIKEKIQS